MQIRLTLTLGILTAIGITASAAHAQSARIDESQKTEAALIAVTDHWSDAEAAGDTAYLNRLLRPEYRSVNSDGSVHAKARLMEGAVRRGGEAAIRELATWRATHHHGTKVLLDDDMAIVTYYDLVRGPELGISSSDILVYRDHRWQALYSAHTAFKS